MLASPNRHSHETVLLVEDDELVCDVMTRALVRQGYLVLTASTADDAIRLLRTPLSPIDIVLLATNPPDALGIDLLTRLRERYPHLKIIVCTGGTDPNAI